MSDSGDEDGDFVRARIKRRGSGDARRREM